MNPKQTKDKIASYHKEGKITLQVDEKAKQVVDELELEGITKAELVKTSSNQVELEYSSVKHEVDITIDEGYTIYTTYYKQERDDGIFDLIGGETLELTPESFKDIAKLLKG